MNSWFSTPLNSKYSLYTADSGFYNYKLSNMIIIPAGELNILFYEYRV